MAMKPGKKGLTRLIHACGYSLSGFRAALRHEAAFRQEVTLFVVLLPILLLLPSDGMSKCLLLLVNTLVLIVELLNSAVEAVVDKVSPEFHELAKRAKDMGSAAVLLSLIIAAVVWATVLYPIFFKVP